MVEVDERIRKALAAAAKDAPDDDVKLLAPMVAAITHLDPRTASRALEGFPPRSAATRSLIVWSLRELGREAHADRLEQAWRAGWWP